MGAVTDVLPLNAPATATVSSPIETGRRWPATVWIWLPSVAPALLMLVVGRFRLRNPTLGWDENATWIASQRTPGQIVDLAKHFDGVISPYYMFMHFWTAAFGDSEFWLRAPSLIAVSLAVGLAGELGRRLFSPGVGLLGGALLVLVPQLTRYAQDARAYGITFLFATLATLLLYRALERPTWARWIPYAVVVTLVGWAHIFGLMVLAGHAYAVLSRWHAQRDRALLRWLIVVPIAVLPVLPLVWLGLHQKGEQLDWIAPMTLDQVWKAPGEIFGSAAAGLLLIGLAFAARASDRRVIRELSMLAVVPPLLLIAVSFAGSPFWVPRYVLFIVPAVTLMAAAALRGLRLPALGAVILLAAVAVPAQRAVRGPASHLGANFRAVSRVISHNQQPGDAIVYGASGTWSLRAGIDYQLRGRERPRDVLLQTPAAEVGQLEAVQCPDEVACLGSSKRVWFFRQWQTGKPLTDAGPLTTTFRTHYRQAGVWHATKATLVLFVRR
jgi:mannosyltransferase